MSPTPSSQRARHPVTGLAALLLLASAAGANGTADNGFCHLERWFPDDLVQGSQAGSAVAFDGDTAVVGAPGREVVAVVTTEGRLRAWDLDSSEPILDRAVGARTGSLRFDRTGDAMAIVVGGGVDELQVRAFPSGAVTHSARGRRISHTSSTMLTTEANTMKNQRCQPPASLRILKAAP